MTKRIDSTLVLIAALIGAASSMLASGVAVAGETALVANAAAASSGIETGNGDVGVRVQDDFYRHVNGTWLKNTEIPADRAGWGAFQELGERSLSQLHGIIEAVANDAPKALAGDERMIGDLFASYMDEARLESLGLKPLKQDLALIDDLKSRKGIPALIAHFNRIGAIAPYDLGIHQDARDSTRYVVDLVQSGLGLPDRDYYLKQDEARMRDVLGKYRAHIEKMLTLVGDKDAAAKSKQIVELETRLARAQWTKVQNRDPVKTYNKLDLAKLNALTKGYDWKSYLATANIEGKVTYVIVSQPSYLKAFNRILRTTPLTAWKNYFAWHVLSSYAHLLNRAIADEDFAFNGTVLTGAPQQEPRWKRAVHLEEGAIGESLGRLYVARYFPPEYKSRMEKLVGNLLAAYRISIDSLDWMSPATKKEAQAKLAAFTAKIGYPNKWRDYSSLKINRDDLVGNVRRAIEFEYQRNVAKLGQPVDRGEWGMTPQTVNAYYDPGLNEIVFPAAILQPPFFNAAADDAVNYGAIGAVIGHEISHGFDDMGAQYDGAGNLRDWWSKEDHRKFKAKTSMLIKQYGGYSPVAGYRLNGELTLGENIADNAGLAIAYKAYRLALAGEEAPLIDGLSGDQRFYVGWAQAWRQKHREEDVVLRLKTDPHSPPQFRANGTVANQAAFYSAFGVGKGDMMYVPPERRVTIW